MLGDLSKETALVEAILYLEGNPIDEELLSKISGLSKDVVKCALENLSERYIQEDCGIELSHIGGGITISPKREYWDNLKERYGRKNEAKFSRAVIETLAIIAHSQPITKAEVDKIRLAPSDNMIKLLVDKDLIRKVGEKKDVPFSPALYGTTKEFLKFFGLNSIAELPKLDEIDRDKFELEGEHL